MDKYQRNLQQIEENITNPMMYIIEKTIEELCELRDELYTAKHRLESKQTIEKKLRRKIKYEMADVYLMLDYLQKKLKFSDAEIEVEVNYKSDRGFEENKKESI